MDKVTDDDVLTVINKLAKQRKDSLLQFTNAGRNDLADKEALELKILEEYLPLQLSEDEIEAIYKASPSLVLVSDGIKDSDCWSFRRRNQFSSSIFVYYHDAFGIFSERIKRVNEKTFERGGEMIPEIIHNPFKFFLIFSFLWYIIILIWYRIFKK